MPRKKKTKKKPVTGIRYSKIPYADAVNTAVGGAVLLETVKLIKP